MKKILLSAAIILSGLISFSTYADTPECNNGNKCEQTECQKGKGRHNHRQRPNLFEGIDLTPEQQTALSNLRPAHGKCEGNRGEEQTRSNAREEFKAKVKEILTPEQYTKFEENASKCKQNKGKHERRGDKKGNMGKKSPKSCEQNCGK